MCPNLRRQNEHLGLFVVFAFLLFLGVSSSFRLVGDKVVSRREPICFVVEGRVIEVGVGVLKVEVGVLETRVKVRRRNMIIERIWQCKLHSLTL
jgi:hypothetical protein